MKNVSSLRLVIIYALSLLSLLTIEYGQAEEIIYYPASDPNNQKNWILRKKLSDEFDKPGLPSEEKWSFGGEGETATHLLNQRLLFVGMGVHQHSLPGIMQELMITVYYTSQQNMNPTIRSFSSFGWRWQQYNRRRLWLQIWKIYFCCRRIETWI